MLFLCWRIGLLSRGLKRIVDSEVADTLFDATLYSIEPQQLTSYQEIYHELEEKKHLGTPLPRRDENSIKLASKNMYISNIEEGVGEIYRVTSCLGYHPFSHWTVHRHFIKPKEDNPSTPALIISSLTNNPGLLRWLLDNLPNLGTARTPWKTQDAFESLAPTLNIVEKRLSGEKRGIVGSAMVVVENEDDLLFTKAMNRDRFAFNCAGVYGYAFGWGSNNMGQLGSVASAEEPSPLINSRPFLLYLPRPILVMKNLLVREVACGYTHSLAILDTGMLLSWGSNRTYQLGLGPNFPDIVPSPLPVKLEEKVISVSCGSEHSVALTERQQVYSWGQGEGGLLGLTHLESQHTPQEVVEMSSQKIKTVVCGGLHTLALSQSGQVWSWGRGEGGQLGVPRDRLISTEEGDLFQNKPCLVDTFKSTKIIQIAAGDAHSLALELGGTAYAWGFSTSGQLGTGAFSHDHSLATPGIQQFTPALVRLPPNKPINKVDSV
jgi:hypothetical protein